MKSNILNRFLAVVILAITVSCGQQTQSKLSGTDSRLGAEVSESASNLFVVLSGNGSCDKGGGTVIAPGLRENELFWAFDQWVMPSGLVKPSDNVLYACYDWQSPVMRLYDLRYRQQMIPINETELDGFVYAHARTARKIVIIGHSHAGWRAMKLASSPLLTSFLPVPILLATIDAVSRVTCQRLREPGCREAPTDFSQMEWSILNTRTVWTNLYHQPAIILGSGPMAAAHFNQNFNANHVQMQTDPYVWQSVRNFIQAYL